MTGYTVHTGSTEKFSQGWDNIFSGGKKAASKKATKKKAAKKKKKPSSSKAAAKKGMTWGELLEHERKEWE